MTKWIAVKDQLLPENKPVLIFVQNHKLITIAMMQISPSKFAYLTLVGAAGRDWEWDFKEKDITHWAELPESPSIEYIPESQPSFRFVSTPKPMRIGDDAIIQLLPIKFGQGLFGDQRRVRLLERNGKKYLCDLNTEEEWPIIEVC